jgi:hypothetical protein
MYRDSKVMQGQTDKIYGGAVSAGMQMHQDNSNMPLNFVGDQHMAQLEM